MKENVVNKFLKVSNDAFTMDNERKLNDKELYFLMYAAVMENKLGIACVHYDFLYKETNLFNDKKASRHRSRAKEVIMSLAKKKYISVEDKGKFVFVKLIDDKLDKNFTQIYHDDFERLNNPSDLYIYACVAKWSRSGVAEYPISVWSKLLGLGETQTSITIKDAIERKVIYKEIGKWAGINKRESNKYSIKPFVKKLSELEEVEETKEKSPALQKVIANETMKDIENEVAHGHQWFATQRTEFTVDDFVVLLTTDDEKIKKAAKKHIDRISKTSQGKWRMEQLRKKAEAQITKEKKDTEQAEEQELKPAVMEMMDESQDIVLLVDDKLVKYADYDQISVVEKVFFYKVIEVEGDYGIIFETKNKPSNIEEYRKENGEWKHEWQL